MTPEQAERLKEGLEARAAELRRAEEASTDERAPVVLDQQSVGRLSRLDALQVQAMANAQSERRRRELRRIEAALARWREGELGYCTKCGEEIGTRRLELDPATPLCIACAK